MTYRSTEAPVSIKKVSGYRYNREATGTTQRERAGDRGKEECRRE